MPYFSYLNDDASLEDIMEHQSGRYIHLSSLAQDIMRGGSSELEAGDRELIAALVSGKNECSYCYGAHKKVASAFGLSEEVIEQLVNDIDAAPVNEKLKPLLTLAAKLTTTPERVVESDIGAASSAGWSEAAIEDTIAVCALFNFANRITMGYGLANLWSDKRNNHIEKLINGGYN